MDVEKDDHSLIYNTTVTCAWKERQKPQNSWRRTLTFWAKTLTCYLLKTVTLRQKQDKIFTYAKNKKLFSNYYIHFMKTVTFQCCIYTFSCSIIQEMILILCILHMYNESSSNYVIFLKFQNTWEMWNKLGNIHGNVKRIRKYSWSILFSICGLQIFCPLKNTAHLINLMWFTTFVQGPPT